MPLFIAGEPANDSQQERALPREEEAEGGRCLCVCVVVGGLLCRHVCVLGLGCRRLRRPTGWGAKAFLERRSFEGNQETVGRESHPPPLHLLLGWTWSLLMPNLAERHEDSVFLLSASLCPGPAFLVFVPLQGQPQDHWPNVGCSHGTPVAPHSLPLPRQLLCMPHMMHNPWK